MRRHTLARRPLRRHKHDILRVKVEARLEFRRRNGSAKKGPRAEETGDFGYVPGSGSGDERILVPSAQHTDSIATVFPHPLLKSGGNTEADTEMDWRKEESPSFACPSRAMWLTRLSLFFRLYAQYSRSACRRRAISVPLCAHKHPARKTNIVSA